MIMRFFQCYMWFQVVSHYQSVQKSQVWTSFKITIILQICRKTLTSLASFFTFFFISSSFHPADIPTLISSLLSSQGTARAASWLDWPLSRLWPSRQMTWLPRCLLGLTFSFLIYFNLILIYIRPSLRAWAVIVAWPGLHSGPQQQHGHWYLVILRWLTCPGDGERWPELQCCSGSVCSLVCSLNTEGHK